MLKWVRTSALQFVYKHTANAKKGWDAVFMSAKNAEFKHCSPTPIVPEMLGS